MHDPNCQCQSCKAERLKTAARLTWGLDVLTHSGGDDEPDFDECEEEGRE